MSIDPSKYNAESPSSKIFSEFQKITKPPPIIYQPVLRKTTPLPVIDETILSNVMKSDMEKREEEMKQINQYVNAEVVQSEESKQYYPSEKTEGRDKKTGKFSLLSIFKIVPIGMNIFKKFPKVMSGLSDIVDGLRKLIFNGVTTTADLVPSIFAYTGLNFMVMLMHIVCAVTNLKNMHICCIPYILDFIWWIIKLICCSFINILDAIFIKRLLGLSLYDYVYYGFEWLSENVHYPDYIINLCYKCKHIENNELYDKMYSAKKNVGKHITKVVTKDVPTRIIDPIRQKIRGISKMTSLFNI